MIICATKRDRNKEGTDARAPIIPLTRWSRGREVARVAGGGGGGGRGAGREKRRGRGWREGLQEERKRLGSPVGVDNWRYSDRDLLPFR